MSVASWDATGLLEAVYKIAGSRDKLAAETGIPAPNLSAINNGRRPLTVDYAERIMAVYPEGTLQSLGGEAATVVQRRRSVLDRLEALEATVAVEGEAVAKSLQALAKEVRALRRELTAGDGSARRPQAQ